MKQDQGLGAARREPAAPGGSTTRRNLLGSTGVAVLGALATSAVAQPSSHGRPAADTAASSSQDERWRRRFPQPVTVSELIGRQMLNRDQGVLGRVEAVGRTSDGTLLIAFARRRLLLLSGETVAVPLKATAALGPFVMILDLSFEEIDRLPPFSPSLAPPLDRATRVEMALTKH